MKKMLASFTVAAIAVLVGMLVLGFHALAEDAAKRGPHIEGGESGVEFMKKFDLDKDGKISHEEWEAVKPATVYRDKHWPEYNKNKDDYITMDEVPVKSGKSEPAPPKPEKKGATTGQIAFIVKFDKDQDGKLSREEFKGKYFDVYDRNSDGFIEAEEAPAGKTSY